jgi:glycerophosphoryl diester phosphodiesterase
MLFFLLSISCTTPQQPKSLDTWMDLQGHRGARGNRPENTRPAFIFAFEQGMTTLELDVVLTKDEYLVIHHNVNTNPALCTEANGVEINEEPIRSLKLSRLQKLNCGATYNPKFPEQQLSEFEQLMSLEEFFHFISDLESKNPKATELKFNIELKFPTDCPQRDINAAAARVVKVITKAKMAHRTTVQSFNLESLTAVQKINNQITLSALFMPSQKEALTLIAGGSTKQSEIIVQATEIGVDVISPHHLFVDADFIAQAHRVDLKVIPWTVNDPARMLELMNLGVDGIISDYPEVLKIIYNTFIEDKK